MAERRRRLARPAVSPAARRTFLEALAAGWSVTEAAKLSATARQRYYELKLADPAFAEQWAEADARGADVVRDELHRRAVLGWDEPVFQMGKLAGHIHRKSDRLLEVLSRKLPELRERQPLELSVRGELEVGVRIEHDYQAILAGLQEVGLISLGPTARAAAKPKALEPGPTQPDGGAT